MSDLEESAQTTTGPVEGNGEVVDQDHPDRLAQPVGDEAPPRLEFPVVGIGASAGGLEACMEFFKAMPSDAGMAFVVVQHLQPDRESMVAEILQRHTKMPVLQVKDEMTVERNHVYVIRPGHTLTIENGALHLGERLDHERHGRPVDDFFRSLANEQRERSISIILSGMGSNGTAGAEYIKAVGGVVIAQDPESAKFPSMPKQLIDSGQADFILRPDEMPPMLLRYVSHPYVRAPWSDDELVAAGQQRHLKEIIAVLRARTRRDFSGYKKPTVSRRILRRMGLNHIEDLGEYAIFLRHNAAEVHALSDDLMIHVTGFFRDAEAWKALQERVIEPLIAEREADGSVRCWVTACSSGEEAYTLSMLLVEAAEAAGKPLDIKVFATDTADRTLAKARLGVYPNGIEAEMSPARLERFFEREDAVYRIKQELREMVVFAPQNVIQDPPFSRLDICTCRNLLIYLEPELQQRVLSLLHFGLREGGALFLGSSETVSGVEDMFEPIDKRARIFRRVGPTRRGSVEFGYPALAPPSGEALRIRQSPKLNVAQATTRQLLADHTPAAVTVDRAGRVVHYHGDTDPFLRQPPGEPTRELLLLARDRVRGAIRTAVQNAMRDNTTARASDGMLETPEGKFRIEVVVSPLDTTLAPGHFLVCFERHDEAPGVEPGPGDSLDAADLRGQLRQAREELQSTVHELQGSNEELRASNEETMSINEELQSTNEELETSKEELQSLNEELTTVNMQLQTKMEELESTTNDLSSLLSSTDIAVIFLDTSLNIRWFTPAAKELVELIPSDIGRPISDLAKKFTDPELTADCARVLNKLTPIAREVRGAGGHVYMRRILPYRTADHRITGTVITFVDVTDLKSAEAALGASEERFRLVLDGAPDFAMLLMSLDGAIVTWNVGAVQMLGYSESEIVGKHASLIYVPEGGRKQWDIESQRAIETGRAADEIWHVRKDGSRLWGSGVLTAIRDEAGNLTALVKVLRDETQRKRAEEELAATLLREQAARREAESAARQKDQFLATLSHELRTPLAAVLAWAQVLREQQATGDDFKNGLEVIERSAGAQKQLLDDLLDTSRISSGNVRLDRRPLPLLPVVQGSVEALLPTATAKGVALDLVVTGDIGLIFGDESRLRQVFSNLMTNAVKFTHAGGKVQVRADRADGWVELTVTDDGDGIDSEFLPRLFTPFSQAESSRTRTHGGLGLGLSICKELVELHGGAIRAESDGTGQGATFRVRLPLLSESQADLPETRGAASNGAEEGSVEGVRILLVEDDAATREALSRFLAGKGATVIPASMADEALAAFQTQQPDVMVSDIGLPGEDGYELMAKIRTWETKQGLAATPAIALTAYAGVTDQQAAHAAGYDAHAAKPIEPRAFVALVAKMARKDRTRGG